MRMADKHGVRTCILGDPAHVLYFTGYSTPSGRSSAVILDGKGKWTLIAPSEDEAAVSAELVLVEPAYLSSLYMDHARRVSEAVCPFVTEGEGLIGLDNGANPTFMGIVNEEIFDLSPVLFTLRRRKDPDELAILKKCIEVTHACYTRAREIIRPGITELEVYAELYQAALSGAGESIPPLGNDYQCASPGGPPRQRETQSGELYILDIGPSFGGYFADNCRTFAVDGDPTEIQFTAWKKVCEVISYIEEVAKPGVSCKQLYYDAKEILDRDWPDSFFHHLGHGVGLYPHERPNLNPHWDHYLEEGDFFAVEPGLYTNQLRAGIRLEENYFMKETGLEKLTSFPLNL
jgi:Xaa-Pro aminopeptidase